MGERDVSVFVVVTLMGVVMTPDVDVVDVVAVWDGDMPTPLAVGVMADVFGVPSGHFWLFFFVVFHRADFGSGPPTH